MASAPADLGPKEPSFTVKLSLTLENFLRKDDKTEEFSPAATSDFSNYRVMLGCFEGTTADVPLSWRTPVKLGSSHIFEQTIEIIAKPKTRRLVIGVPSEGGNTWTPGYVFDFDLILYESLRVADRRALALALWNSYHKGVDLPRRSYTTAERGRVLDSANLDPSGDILKISLHLAEGPHFGQDASTSGSDPAIQQFSDKLTHMLELVKKLKQQKISLHIMVAVNFTRSNGPIDSPMSLHDMQPPDSEDPVVSFNQYQRALVSVIEVLKFCALGKPGSATSQFKVSVLGFGCSYLSSGSSKGARVTEQALPDYEFGPVPRVPTEPFKLDGFTYDKGPDHLVQNVLGCYSKFAKSVEISGPTCFAPMIEKAKLRAEAKLKSGSKEYIILVILTNGDFDDELATIKQVVEATRAPEPLPLSIVTVGIGSCSKFAVLKRLDGDDQPLSYKDDGLQGRIHAVRDIFQYVGFLYIFRDEDRLRQKLKAERKHQRDGAGGPSEPKIKGRRSGEPDPIDPPNMTLLQFADSFSPLMGMLIYQDLEFMSAVMDELPPQIEEYLNLPKPKSGTK